MEKMRKECVSSGYIVKDKKVLLVLHKEINEWLPPGGHMDDAETPEEALVREAKEETGLDVEVMGNKEEADTERVTVLRLPDHMQLEDIDSEHQHIDPVFFCRVVGGEEMMDETEVAGMRWFSLQELESEGMSKNIRHFAEKAIKRVG